MAHEQTVLQIIQELRILTAEQGGRIMSAKGIWASGTSARNNFHKSASSLEEVEKGEGFFRVKGCRSEFKEHAQMLSECLTELKCRYDLTVYREHSIKEVGLRPDAICLARKENQGWCFFLEVCHNEPLIYLKQKLSALRSWKGGNRYLSELFGITVPCFDIVIKGYDLKNTIPYKEALNG